MTAPSRGLALAELAQGVLDHLVRYWDTATGVAPLPGRRAILAGEPRGVAWDCEQLTLSLEGIGWGPAEDASAPIPVRPGSGASALSVRHAVLVVTLVRCTPSGGRNGAPTADTLHAAGLAYLGDAGMLSQAMVEYASRLAPTLPREASVTMGVVAPVGPSGGYHGLETTVVITAAKLV